MYPLCFVRTSFGDCCRDTALTLVHLLMYLAIVNCILVSFFDLTSNLLSYREIWSHALVSLPMPSCRVNSVTRRAADGTGKLGASGGFGSPQDASVGSELNMSASGPVRAFAPFRCFTLRTLQTC